MAMKARYTVLDGQIVAEKRGANRKFDESDALGSTVALYDNTQTKTDSFTYWPYGETRTSTGSTGTKFKYVGTLGCRTQFDGGIYMRARVQQPDEGRWMTVDPLWPRELPYAYCLNRPPSLIDPSGELWQIIVGGIVAIGALYLCSLHGVNAGCREPNKTEQEAFNRCYNSLKNCGIGHFLQFRPNLICNDLAEKTDAVADTNGNWGRCNYRVDYEDWKKLDSDIGCKTLLHESLHCGCRLFYNGGSPEHDNLDDWATHLQDCCKKKKPNKLSKEEICRRIHARIPPPKDC